MVFEKLKEILAEQLDVDADSAPFFISFQKVESLPFVIIAILLLLLSNSAPFAQPNRTAIRKKVRVSKAVAFLIFMFLSFLNFWNFNRYGCADVKLAINRNSVFLSEIYFQSVIYILNTDTF